MSVLNKLTADPKKYSFEVKTLGPCQLPSPVKGGGFVGEDERVYAVSSELYTRYAEEALGHKPTFESAGAHEKIFHDPNWTRAAILTAGGLCPGLNTVIKGLVEILSFDYGVKSIIGIPYGYAGLNPKFGYEPVMLNPDVVDTIHEIGGTILGSSRGNQPVDVMVDTLVRMNINVLFCIGGDGTLRGASQIAEEVAKRGLKISVVGVPKTVDNDLMFVGRSFGFETAVSEAANVIRCAHVEAKGTPHGIGLVRVMGRDSGFIAVAATMANPVVNFCLIPEMQFALEGEGGLLAALENRFRAGKTHAVIVVAEGAGQELLEGEEKRDASGNILKKDIGEFLKTRIADHFRERGIPSSVKYFDPSYIVRSGPARGTDSVKCYMLARSAVHAAMAGRTDCVVGNIGEEYVLVPIALATIERQKVHLDSEIWRSTMDATGQEYYFKGAEREHLSRLFAP